MTLTVSQWPFWPEEQRTPEQIERWWAECYVPSPADVTLRGVAHSVIISGETGSGKSVTLKALERMEADRLLIVRYPIARWPGEPHAWVANYNHLGQIMACVSMKIKKFLTGQPDKLNQLTAINLEFLRWLIEKHSDKRAFRRWADVINNPALLELLKYPFDDLYPTDTELKDVQGQIEELVTISRRFGFEGVAVIVDVNETEVADEATLDKVKELFGWLTPLQFEGFAIKAALPDSIVKKTQLVNLSRGRINFASLRWTLKDCQELGNRYLKTATENKIKTFSNIASKTVLTTLAEEIEALYGDPLPRAWLGLTATLLDHYTKLNRKLTTRQYDDLIHAYFANYVPLELDKVRRGVWRGKDFIPLDDQPFSFMKILWQHRDGSYANEFLLREVAGNQGNLNTLANRLRKKIERTPDNPIYILNTRSQGYWLENVVEAKSS